MSGRTARKYCIEKGQRAKREGQRKEAGFGAPSEVAPLSPAASEKLTGLLLSCASGELFLVGYRCGLRALVESQSREALALAAQLILEWQ